MPIFNVSGALKLQGDRATNIEVRHTGSVVTTAATYLDFSGSAVQGITLGSGGGVVINLSGSSGGGGSSSDPTYWQSTTLDVVFTTGSMEVTGSSLFKSAMAVSGAASFVAGLSGSLTKLTDGTSFLVAGTNIAISTGSKGQVTIAYTGSNTEVPVYWYSPSNEQVETSGSMSVTGSALFKSTLIASGAASFVAGLSGSLTKLTNGTSYLVAGTNISVTTGSSGQVTIEYSGTDPDSIPLYWYSLANNNVETSGSMSVTGSGLFKSTLVASGVASFPAGLSGSLTKLTDNSSYLIAGNNVTITSNSNGSVTIAASGGGGGESYWFSPSADVIHTTGSVEVTGSALIKQNLNVTGSSFLSGTATFYSGLSGSLTQLQDGSSYLVAGTNVTITSNSNGSVTIASTGGGGSGGRTFTWNANGVSDYFVTTTGSSGFDISASFDGARRTNSAATIQSAFANLVMAGTAGTSSIEIYRRRAGTMTRMATFDVPYTSGDYAVVSGTLDNTDLEVADVLYAQFTAVMSGARDISIEVNAS